MRKILFSTLLSLLMPMAASAYDAEINGIYYNFSGSEATVTYKNTNYNSYSGQVIIPNSVTSNDKKYSVTSIGNYAFFKCSGLTSVTIPNSVTSISEYAFSDCGLTSVTIPNSVTSISKFAFSDCGLTTITIISNNALCIEDDAFYGSNKLKKVIVPDIAAWCGISCGANSANPLYYAHHLYIDEETEITDLVIPDGVTSIGSAFCYCTGLTSVTIPNSVTSIGNRAFYGCSGLTSITIPSSVISIGGDAFSRCSGLTSVTISDGVTTIGGYAFYECRNLTSVTFGNSVTSIGVLAFCGCYSLKSLTFPDSLISIGNNAFGNCSSLTSVTFGNSVTSIDGSAFGGCYSLKSLTFPDSLISIGSSAFANCSSLTSVTFGNSVTSIGVGAFGGCYCLTSVKALWDTPITIESNVFSNDTYDTATLYTPVGTLDAYKADEVWSKFQNIRDNLCFVNVEATGGGTLTFNEENLRNESKRVIFEQGTDITFEGKPDKNYDFKNLTVNGEAVTTTNDMYTLANLQSHINVVATFTEKPKFDITATATGGTVSLNGATPSASQIINVYRDTDVTLTIKPNEGHELSMITVNGSDVSAQLQDNTLKLDNIQEAKTIVVNFTKIMFTITNLPTENGTIKLSKTEVEWDDSFTATFKPATGYEFATATVNGKDVTANVVNNVLTVTNVKENKTVGGSFKKQTFSVTVSGDGVSVSNTRPEYGDNVTVTIADDPDRTLVSLLVNGEDVTAQVVNGQYVITNVDVNVTVEATFKSTKEFITMTDGYAMFSCDQDLDFTDSDLCAYIAAGFNKATNQVLLVRVCDVPARTGIYLKGIPGTTYKVPYSETASYYVNLFKANLEKSTIYATAGEYTNYTFNGQNGEPGFNPVTNNVTLEAKTAYLQLPSSFVTAGVKVSVVFEEDIIDGIEDFRISDTDETIYDLAGRRLSKTRRGINIVNGKKTLR